MQRNLIVAALVAVLMAGFVLAYQALTPAQVQPTGGMATGAQDGSMAGMGGRAADGPVVPPVTGFAEGQEILFLHTEASDPKIAKMLTDMMGSPVPTVPALAQAPNAMLANVYVFTNGITGEGARGPLGFQPDVFDSPVGAPGYSPLRALNLVTWKSEPGARVLKSAADVKSAEAKGEVTVERPGIVVNMPFVTWPGGQR